MSLGQMVRERRELLGMSRAELAEHLEITASGLARIETDLSLPSLRTFEDLCSALHWTGEQVREAVRAVRAGGER